MNLNQYISIKDFGIDITPKSLNECLPNKLQDLNESFGIDRTFISEKEVPEYGYVIKTETWKIPTDKSDPGTEMHSAYTPDGTYIGDIKMAKFLSEKKGITKFEKTKPSHNVCSIGFNEKENKWYGYSHRAICGFGIGDKLFDQDFGDDKTLFTKHGKETIKNLDQAKQAAKNFAEYVS